MLGAQPTAGSRRMRGIDGDGEGGIALVGLQEDVLSNAVFSFATLKRI